MIYLLLYIAINTYITGATFHDDLLKAKHYEEYLELFMMGIMTILFGIFFIIYMYIVNIIEKIKEDYWYKSLLIDFKRLFKKK